MNTFSSSRLFAPQIISNYINLTNTEPTEISGDKLKENHDLNLDSWKYDPQGSALKSTQQLPVDWREFQNHVFFNSAEAKVNLAFDRVINEYPFDGTALEYVEYMDNIDGYEKYILGQWPKYNGYITLSNSSSNFVTASDSAGYLFPALSKRNDRDQIIGRGIGDLGGTIEYWLAIPTGSFYINNEVVFQKLASDGNSGITLALKKSHADEPTAELMFLVSSGTSDDWSRYLVTSASIVKGQFNHVAATIDLLESAKLRLFIDGELKSTSSLSADLGPINFNNADIRIGSGSTHQYGTNLFTPNSILNGSVDEFRVWGDARNSENIKKYMKKPVFAQTASYTHSGSLLLYYKFNEPTGSYNNNHVMLDHSGNGIHAKMENFNMSTNRGDKGYGTPMSHEKLEFCPTLFPDHPDLIAWNVTLMNSASQYDANNPNMITKLVPRHYFLEAQYQEGFLKEDGDVSNQYGYVSDAFPRDGHMPNVQIITSLLFIWASFFDEMKLYIDSFGKLLHPGHGTYDVIPDQFLNNFAQYYGFELPSLFASAPPSQYHHGEDILIDSGSGTPLKEAQNQMWRRMLSELPEIMRSKGTKHSVFALIRAAGIEPDANFRYREFGGAPSMKLEGRRQQRKKHINFINFKDAGSSPFVTSSELSAYRHEPGPPYPDYSPTDFVIDSGDIKMAVPNPIPELKNLTTASWAIEGQFIFPIKTNAVTQSLFRLDTIDNSGNAAPVVNLLAYSGSHLKRSPGGLRLYVSCSENGLFDLYASSSVNIFDGQRWYVNLNHKKYTQFGEYTIRAYRPGIDYIEAAIVASQSYRIAQNIDVLGNKTAGWTSPKLSMGPGTSYAGTRFLNYAADALPHHGTVTSLDARVSNIKFWSKALEESEAKEHALNVFSFGVENPLVNYNFPVMGLGSIDQNSSGISSASAPYGSWERLRMHYNIIHEVTSSTSDGTIRLFDESQNEYYLTGSGWTASSPFTSNQAIIYSIYDPNWDQAALNNKVRIRSSTRAEEWDYETVFPAPLHELPFYEDIADDRRFSIEVSLVQALNEDIANIFSSMKYLENIVGTPEAQYGINYPRLDRLREVYFNRLTDRMNFQQFFEFFKWFDTNFSILIDRLIPRTAEFLGMNFVVESHMLERHKMQYKQADVHISLEDRLAARIEPIYLGVLTRGAT